MAQTINTNVASLNAQRNLSTSQSSLATSLQRLSSGLRINSAKDDAAGLAISERFSTQVRGINQAVRNANDGISLTQTAEGALSEVGNNLQRIRELAVQSRNATNSPEDRAALQKEVTQLKSEIERVAKTTSFNGTKLLDGSFTDQAFQVGANKGETINVASITNAKISALGSWEKVTAEAKVTGAAVSAGDISGLEIAGQTVNVTGVTADAAGATAVASAINTALQNGGVTNIVATTDTNTVVLTASDGASITIGGDVTNSGLSAATTDATKETKTGFQLLDISTVTGADDAMLAMDGAIKAINDTRADLGAIQNRFASTIANLQTTSENLSASRGRIVDADFASETANLTRSQILQQAGTAMLAQANGLPQNVLSLLRG